MIEATSERIFLGQHFTVDLQVVFGCAWMVHPQPQAFVADELEARYGNRVRSRMRQLFNLIAFDEGTADKRK